MDAMLSRNEPFSCIQIDAVLQDWNLLAVLAHECGRGPKTASALKEATVA